MHDKDTLIRVTGVWKRYCRNLKTSLYYALCDIARDAFCFRNRNLSLRKREFWGLQDINFELKRGETLGIVGPNGAGKSTLLKLLNGIIKPTRGQITVNGSMQALIELGGAFSLMLSGRENILVSGAVLGIRRRDLLARLDEIIEFAELEEFIDSPVATYSTGMRVRLGFSVATIIQPEILILDEVLSVGDIGFQMKSLDKVARIREQAGAVVFVSHNVNQLRRLCTRCLLLDHGRMICYGEPDEVIDAYVHSQNLRIAKGTRMKGEGLVIAEGIEFLGWGIEQGEGPSREVLSRGPFRIWYTIALSREIESVGLDIVLLNEAMQPVISQTFHCSDLEGVTGEHTICIEFPDLHLASHHFFPYIAVVDQTTLKKVIKFLDPVGFTIQGRAQSHAVLDPQLGIHVKSGVCREGD
ncbi:MAG: ABC transporter ATP-binding protein [bacterium]